MVLIEAEISELQILETEEELRETMEEIKANLKKICAKYKEKSAKILAAIAEIKKLESPLERGLIKIPKCIKSLFGKIARGATIFVIYNYNIVAITNLRLDSNGDFCYKTHGNIGKISIGQLKLSD